MEIVAGFCALVIISVFVLTTYRTRKAKMDNSFRKRRRQRRQRGEYDDGEEDEDEDGGGDTLSPLHAEGRYTRRATNPRASLAMVRRKMSNMSAATMNAASAAVHFMSLRRRRPADYRAQLVAFYREHRPEALQTLDVDAVLAKYRGHEDQLLSKLEKMVRDGKFGAAHVQQVERRTERKRRRRRRGSLASVGGGWIAHADAAAAAKLQQALGNGGAMAVVNMLVMRGMDPDDVQACLDPATGDIDESKLPLDFLPSYREFMFTQELKARRRATLTPGDVAGAAGAARPTASGPPTEGAAGAGLPRLDASALLKGPASTLSRIDSSKSLTAQAKAKGPGNGPLVGHRVRVVSVTSKTELNGMVGTADAWNEEKGRYKVLLDVFPNVPINLKPANVVGMEGEAVLETSTRSADSFARRAAGGRATADADEFDQLAALPEIEAKPRRSMGKRRKTRKKLRPTRKKGGGWRERARARRRASVAKMDASNLSPEALAKIKEAGAKAAEEQAEMRARQKEKLKGAKQKLKAAAKKAAMLAAVAGGTEQAAKADNKEEGTAAATPPTGAIRATKRKGKGKRGRRGVSRANSGRRISQERLLSLLEVAKLRQQHDAATEPVQDGSGDTIIRSPPSNPVKGNNAFAQFQARIEANTAAATAENKRASRSRQRRSSLSGLDALRPSGISVGSSKGAAAARRRRRSSVSDLSGINALRPSGALPSPSTIPYLD